MMPQSHRHSPLHACQPRAQSAYLPLFLTLSWVHRQRCGRTTSVERARPSGVHHEDNPAARSAQLGGARRTLRGILAIVSY